MADETTGNQTILSANCSEWNDRRTTADVSFVIKFWTVLVCGSAVSVAGVVASALLLVVFLRQRTLRRSHLVYALVLAVLDGGILLTYIAVFSTKLLYQSLESREIYGVWVTMLSTGQLFIVSKVVLLAQTYLIVAMTVERFCQVYRMKNGADLVVAQTTRYVVIFCVLVGCVLFQLPVFWELKFVEVTDCLDGRPFVELGLSKTAQRDWFRYYYKGWANAVVRVFLPFGLLLALNIGIIVTWKKALQPPSATDLLARLSIIPAETVIYPRKNTNNSTHSQFEPLDQARMMLDRGHEEELSRERELRRRELRSATTMLVALVTSYLLCNTLNLLLIVWERVKDVHLLEPSSTAFVVYTVLSDLVSLLVAINSAARLPIYYACNYALRAEINQLLCRFRPPTATPAGSNNNVNLLLITRLYRRTSRGQTTLSPSDEEKREIRLAKVLRRSH